MPHATGPYPAPFEGQLDVFYRGDVEDTTWEVVHHFATDGSELTPVPDLELLLDQLYALFTEWIVQPFCSTELHFHEVWGHLFSITRSRVRVKKAGAAVGGVSGPVAPAQVATLINWETLERHRGGQPCSYIAGVPMAHLVDNAHFLDALVDELSLSATNYVNEVRSLSAGTIEHVELVDLSLVSGGVYRATAEPTTVVSGSIRRVPATQRRRIDRAA